VSQGTEFKLKSQILDQFRKAKSCQLDSLLFRDAGRVALVLKCPEPLNELDNNFLVLLPNLRQIDNPGFNSFRMILGVELIF
jgi:hypothetical protein